MYRIQTIPAPLQARRGLMLLDMLVAGIAISTAVIIAVSSIAIVQRSRHRADRLQYAAQELNNQLERATSLKWEQLTPEVLAKVQLSEAAQERLPGAKLKLSVTVASELRPAKKVEAQINWPEIDQTTDPPLHLTTWVFAHQETP
ncbi:MAG: hypothetical protein JWM11_2153 [Planctomycetaceae bacterium]|nr:hypothetical protein [Planctomycetaceae bacterium]